MGKMRSAQGLLFVGIAIFSVKWEFVSPITDYGEAAIDTLPPMKPWMHLAQATVLVAIGAYLLGTGEWMYWRRRAENDRYSGDTFLAAISLFLAVFVAKFAYADFLVDPDGFYPPYSGYYPPFNEEGLCAAYLVLFLLGIYYLVRGEAAFWKRREVLPQLAGR